MVSRHDLYCMAAEPLFRKVRNAGAYSGTWSGPRGGSLPGRNVKSISRRETYVVTGGETKRASAYYGTELIFKPLDSMAYRFGCSREP